MSQIETHNQTWGRYIWNVSRYNFATLVYFSNLQVFYTMMNDVLFSNVIYHYLLLSSVMELVISNFILRSLMAISNAAYCIPTLFKISLLDLMWPLYFLLTLASYQVIKYIIRLYVQMTFCYLAQPYLDYNIWLIFVMTIR